MQGCPERHFGFGYAACRGEDKVRHVRRLTTGGVHALDPRRATLWAEGLFRTFNNRKQAAALPGWPPRDGKADRFIGNRASPRRVIPGYERS